MKKLTSLSIIALLLAAAYGFVPWPLLPLGYAQPADQGAEPERKILYYRNPMGLPDISPVPKKDQMGMDYIPVYEGEQPQGDEVRISPAKVQKLGVRTEPATRRAITRPLRAVGIIEVNERSLFTVAPRFEGWIERLYVNAGGETVKRGQALMEVYSPELVSAQQEYVIAVTGESALRHSSEQARAGIRDLAEAAMQRLRNWDIPEDQLRRLRTEGSVRRTLTLRAPAAGVVLEKMAVQGMRFMPGEALYRIADLSALWLMAEVFEQDLGMIHPGQTVRIVANAYPDRTFQGKVSFIYPTLNPQTRTARVRIELPNSKGLLKPAMYASVEIAAGHDTAPVVTVPTSAVISTGTRQVVLVERGEGRYQPRPVKLGLQGDEHVQVLEGIAEGENVVVSANFLIDAESNLRAVLNAFESGKSGDDGGAAAGSAPASAGSTGHTHERR